MVSDHTGRDYDDKSGSGLECTSCLGCDHKKHAGPCSYEAPPNNPDGGIWVKCGCKNFKKCGQTFTSISDATFHKCGG